MHSGLLVALWLAGVAVLQFLDFGTLMAAVGLCAVAAVLYAPRRCVRLLKRIRFLLLAIVVLFAGFTPGEALLIDWPKLSPSREGTQLAMEHAGRVLAVVFCVAILLESLPAPRLVGALYALLRPFERVGFPAGTVAVRTLLVLRLVDAETSPGWKTWLREDGGDVHGPIRIERERFGAGDLVVLIVATALIVLLGLAA